MKSERYDEAARLRVLMKEVGKPPLRRKGHLVFVLPGGGEYVSHIK